MSTKPPPFGSETAAASPGTRLTKLCTSATPIRPSRFGRSDWQPGRAVNTAGSPAPAPADPPPVTVTWFTCSEAHSLRCHTRGRIVSQVYEHGDGRLGGSAR